MSFKHICDSCQNFENGACEKHPKGYPTNIDDFKRDGKIYVDCPDFKLSPEPIDQWHCDRCGEDFSSPEGKKPVLCPNPNCGKRLWLRKIPKAVLEERAELEALGKITPEELKEITAEMGPDELRKVLGLTIKHDDTNKLIHFLAGVLTYTENSQVNISNRGPSSIGKSYLPIEISTLYFSKTDVQMIAYASPTSFFHEVGEWDDEVRGYRVNLERKLLIFLDQPHDILLQRLRPLLSHDQKELVMKITDKREKKGMRTKSVIIRGFPTVFFCTGSLEIDEQEATRSFVLSPETTAEKIREAIFLKASRKGNPIEYAKMLKQNPEREQLRKRVLLIKNTEIKNIIIKNPTNIAERFIESFPKLKPRHSRDIERIISLAQGFALLNLWNRERDSGTLYVNQRDIDNAFGLYAEIAECQELGIAPYIYRVFKEVIGPLYYERNRSNEGGGGGKVGVERKDVVKRYFETYGRPLSDRALRKEILPALESIGFIAEEEDPNDRRKKVIHVYSPTPECPISPPKPPTKITDTIYAILSELESQYDGGVPADLARGEAEKQGISREVFRSFVKEAKTRGHIYEPRPGCLSLTIKGE